MVNNETRFQCGTPGGPRSASSLVGHPAMRNTQAVPLAVNRYAGMCSLCGHALAAGAGYVEKVRGSWVVFH